LLVPVAVGVPEIRPVAEARLRPAGRVPTVTDHAYGVVPPLACTALEYDLPFVPEGKLDVETVNAVGVGAATIGRVIDAVVVLSALRLPAAELESVTLTLKV
jgi:hypothetical protein